MLKSYLKQIYLHLRVGASPSQIKYYSLWKNALKPGASSVKDQQPWITFQAIDFLKKILKKNSKVFEFGGGGSTLFFTSRAGEVVTTEHNKEWFAVLTDVVKKKSISNWKGSLIEAAKGDLLAAPEKANPDHYSSGDKESKGYNYKAYASSIDKFEDSYFDFILVDGRSRPSCIKHSLSKLKKHGYLIVDNSDREYYLEYFKEILAKDFIRELDGFGPTPYLKHFTKTTIWRKK